MMTWAQWGLQDALSPMMEEFIFFHDFTMVILIFITVLVVYVIMKTLSNKLLSLALLESQMIECVWTLIPAVILIQVAVPSLMLLYQLDEAFNSEISLKVVGHQWYWSYEYTDFWSNSPTVSFDAYMLSSDGVADNWFRLLDTDNRTTLPYGVAIRLLVGSSDVLHSWALPSLGVKADAAPGRLNQLNFLSQRPGVFYGQCSEICGANHSFMPISTEFISSMDYFWWASTNK